MSSAANASATTGAAGGGGGGGGAPSGPQGPSPDEVMVYWLDIALLCALGVFFLAFLPRAIARFSNFSEWTRGLLFRSGHPVDLLSKHNLQDGGLRRVNTVSSLEDEASDHSHTLANHTQYGYAKSGKECASMQPGVTSPPKHVPALASLLYPFSIIIAYPVSPRKSLGKLMLMAVYLGGILFVVFFDGGNPLADTNRLGYIAISQIPVAVALGTKNNVVGTLLGMGYERLNFLHRWVGIVTFGAAFMHAIGYIYSYAIAEKLSESFQTPYIQHGLIGLTGVSLLFLASLSVVRQRAYTLFLFAHITGIVLFFVGICFHEPVCKKYVLLALGIYGFDHLFRIIKTRISTARLTALPELGITRIELPRVRAGWRAGQHVRLRVLSGEMGLVGWSVAHPFTIASASGSDGLVLMCKKAGGWTGRLFAAAARSDSEASYGGTREMKVIVEGPYGGVGNMVMSSYSSVLLVAGGSGITFALGQAEELTQSIGAGKSAVRFIELVWVTQDKASVTPLLPVFSSLLSSVASAPGVVLRITIHYTRVDKAMQFAPDGRTQAGSSLDAHLATLAPNLTLNSGRPSLPRALRAIASLTSAVPRASGLAVGVCGPLGLVQESRSAVRSVDGELRSACGGIEIHEETFGW